MAEPELDITPATESTDAGDTGSPIDGDTGAPDSGGSGDSGDVPPAAAADPSQNGRQQPANRKERRDMWRENQALAESNRKMQESLQQLSDQNRELNENLRGFNQRLDANRPRPEDPRQTRLKELRKEIDRTVARLGDDPQAYDRWMELQQEQFNTLAELKAEQIVQKSMPQPQREPSPEFKQFVRDFPFADSPVFKQMINAKAARIADARRLDMNNPRILHQTLREAAAWVAKVEEIDIPGASQRNGTSVERVSGTTGRAGSPRGANPVSGLNDDDIAEAASIMYPNLPRPQAVDAWKKNVGRTLGVR